MAIPYRLLMGVAFVLIGTLGYMAGRVTVLSSEQEVLLREVALLRQTVEARGAAQPLAKQCAVSAPSAAAVDMAALRAEVAQVLRTELAAHGGGAAKPESQEPPPPSSQAVAARQESLWLLEKAMRSRQWREQDALAVRQLLAQMTDYQRQEVMQRISATLNEGSIDVQVHGPPF